jgi:hypothetical protein
MTGIPGRPPHGYREQLAPTQTYLWSGRAHNLVYTGLHSPSCLLLNPSTVLPYAHAEMCDSLTHMPTWHLPIRLHMNPAFSKTLVAYVTQNISYALEGSEPKHSKAQHLASPSVCQELRVYQ